MANKKKQSKKQGIRFLDIKREFSFSDYKDKSIEVGFDENLVSKYFAFPNDGDLYSSISERELLDEFESLDYQTSTNSSFEDYKNYTLSAYVPKDLFRFVTYLLSEHKIENASIAGTICISLLRTSFWVDSYKGMDFTFETKAEKRESAVFFDFLMKYQNGEVDIDSIKIKTGRNIMVKDIIIPIHWFNAFYDNYMFHVKASGLATPEAYLQNMKKQATSGFETFATGTIQINKVIRTYANGFDRMFSEEFRINPKYKRHQFIGNLFSEVEILPSLSDIRVIIRDSHYHNEQEYLADRIKEFIRLANKGK